jgi:eukaryotic-like serine/threonine-protein kinase
LAIEATAMTTPGASEHELIELRKRYHVIGKLGEGGMAVVHLAVVLGVGGVRKLVVLKSIRPELVADSRMREMFLREARLAATLNHPNIVQTFEVVMFAGRPVLVMEYMDGQSLAKILYRDRRERVPLALQLYVLKEVLNGLDYLHNLTDLDGTPLNLVHRDISPPNIFVTYDGHVKILDFGIAKNIRSSANTEAGVIKGKIRYMAPEQFTGTVGLDRRADIFAVGVVLWEAITGKRLWEGLPEVQVMQSLLEGSIPTPSSAAPNVPPALEAVCNKALSRACDDRYESAAAMQMALEGAIDGLGLRTSHRQVGKLVSELFAERRLKTKNILERQLRDSSPPISFVLSDETDADGTDDAVVSADLWRLPTVVALPPSLGWTDRLHKVAPLASLAIALIAASIVVFGALSRSRHEADGHVQTATIMNASATGAPASAPSPPEEHSSVRVSIRATPPRARLFLDDVPLAGNPFDGEVASDSGHHSVHAEAPGYHPHTRAVTLATPLDLKVDLQPAAAVSAAAPATARPPLTKGAVSSVSGASEPAASSARSCRPPFYFDQGIKYFRPECLK